MNHLVDRRFGRSLPEFWRLGWGLVWPVVCAGCGLPDVALCRPCRVLLAGPAFRIPMVGWPPGWGVWAATQYGGVPARCLVTWKERGRYDLTRFLAAGLAAAASGCRAAHPDSGDSGDPWLLIPMPSSAAARRRRGRDLMADLSRQAAAQCAVRGPASESRPPWPGPPPLSMDALRHIRRVRDQAELGRSSRRANLSGALAVPAGLRSSLLHRKCVVVDDIVTTGASAAEAARALTRAGARVVGVCCLSVTLGRQGVSTADDLD